MVTRLPPDARWHYQRNVRQRADRWGFVLVAVAVLCLIEFIGDLGVLNLQGLASLPSSLGFTMLGAPPARRHQGFAAPMFVQADEHEDDAPGYSRR